MIRLMLVVICWLALVAPAWAGYDEGVAAFERGDYETAVREFQPLARQGGAAGLACKIGPPKPSSMTNRWLLAPWSTWPGTPPSSLPTERGCSR